jgi:hypothetical protein
MTKLDQRPYVWRPQPNDACSLCGSKWTQREGLIVCSQCAHMCWLQDISVAAQRAREAADEPEPEPVRRGPSNLTTPTPRYTAHYSPFLPLKSKR